MFHPSLLLLFLDGFFETIPDFDIHDILTNFPDLKAQVKRTPYEDEQFGYLAKFLPPTCYEPKEFDNVNSVDNDTTLINDQNHNISDFLKPRTSTLGNSVFTQCLNPLFCTFLVGDFVPQRESKESMHSGNRYKTERDDREGFCDQCCRVDVKGKSTEQYWESFSTDSQRILLPHC